MQTDYSSLVQLLWEETYIDIFLSLGELHADQQKWQILIMQLSFVDS